MTSATLLALPPELIERLALHLATRPPNLGAPAALIPLLCTCRSLYDLLAPSHNAPLYARIARAKFSLGDAVLDALQSEPEVFAGETTLGGKGKGRVYRDASILPGICRALRVIRSGDVFQPLAASALRTAYAMLLVDDTPKAELSELSYALPPPPRPTSTEDGVGKNKRQLGWAGVREFALGWIRCRMWEGRYGERDAAAQNHDRLDWNAEWASQAWRVGWPRDSNASAAAMWILFFFESKDSLAAEPDAFRQHIMALLLPFVVAPFRYASALAPPHHYTVPLLPAVRAQRAEAITVPTFHGAYPIYPLGKPSPPPPQSASTSATASHRATRKLRHPSTSPKTRLLLFPRRSRILCAPPARLLFFARIQAGGRMGIPPHLPVDRAAAERRHAESGNAGMMPVGPTQADLVEKNARPVVRFERNLPPPVGKGKGRREEEWAVEPGFGLDGEEGRDGGGEGGGEARWKVDGWRGRVCRGYGGEGDVASDDDDSRSSPRGGAAPGRMGKVYELGSFAGLWAGTMVMPAEGPYTQLISIPGGALPPGSLTRDDFVAAARPVYMRIREHWSFYPQTPCPPPEADAVTGDEGLAGAWFPRGVRIVEGGGRAEVRVGEGEGVFVYESVEAGAGVHDVDTCPGCRRVEGRQKRQRRRAREEGPSASASPPPSPSSDTGPSPWPRWTRDDEEDDDDDDEGWEAFCDGVQDVVFTGETDPHHGQAWHHYDFSGRVRPWDGLIGILMRPRNRSIGLATYFICGHLVGRDTFEGTWQMASQDVLAPSWGGSVCLARGEE
ncbi:hypothetical protein MKEN_00559800 [Mycena kentingensis (nom. inval.)]|nr:hypothetical protein MKEN_00559800 [Mycena kentingensis (nom. inval.)]